MGKTVEAGRVISANASFELFDDQASIFDQRAGLPVEYCRAIARAVVEIGQLAPGDLIIEVGPGTGQIGRYFSSPIYYVGIDKSAGMLKQFQSSANHQLSIQGATLSFCLTGGSGRLRLEQDGVGRPITGSRNRVVGPALLLTL